MRIDVPCFTFSPGCPRLYTCVIHMSKVLQNVAASAFLKLLDLGKGLFGTRCFVNVLAVIRHCNVIEIDSQFP
jgi:hypothetical protein